MTDRSGDNRLADTILDTLTSSVGVRVIDEWTSSDTYLFRGPHGRLEHLHYSENLDHWKRGLYQIDGVLRSKLVDSIVGHPQWSGWHYVRRDKLGEPKPVVIGISEPFRCKVCDERFPSGNAFGWHLADVHEIDTEDKMDYAVPEPEEQHTLAKWAGGSA
ncbi:hypothetical protein DM2_1341 [Halorubrum sp. DM2]|uniref:C2H2-type zinc finger protein n=1 Tax=Halorubrum sp. DM2 TaxID=2527867 RepID=UPI0024B7C234|nr:C2H2-type zinc finger protein [Halorubrum sp. DM2]VTT88007.1 hypothetical protein DM2_1341 [Halorubrum sp. DM2]